QRDSRGGQTPYLIWIPSVFVASSFGNAHHRPEFLLDSASVDATATRRATRSTEFIAARSDAVHRPVLWLFCRSRPCRNSRRLPPGLGAPCWVASSQSLFRSAHADAASFDASTTNIAVARAAQQAVEADGRASCLAPACCLSPVQVARAR